MKTAPTNFIKRFTGLLLSAMRSKTDCDIVIRIKRGVPQTVHVQPAPRIYSADELPHV